jgi:hypothetical protein
MTNPVNVRGQRTSQSPDQGQFLCPVPYLEVLPAARVQLCLRPIGRVIAALLRAEVEQCGEVKLVDIRLSGEVEEGDHTLVQLPQFGSAS